MIATEELRRLLDERGVEWSKTKGAADTVWTHWDASNGHRVHAMDNEDGTVEIFGDWDVIPEQAIAATLGATDAKPTQTESSGTCEYCNGKSFDGQTVMISNHGWQRINFCPNCGRKVVDPTTNDVDAEVDA